MRRDREKAKQEGLDYVELSDEDLINFRQQVEEEKNKDYEMMSEEEEEEGEN